MKPNVCNDCGLNWEPTLFARTFLASWFSILVLAVAFNITKNEFWKSDAGAVVFFSFMALLFVAPAIGWYVKPYKVWGGSLMVRRIINYGCLGTMALVIVFYFINANN